MSFKNLFIKSDNKEDKQETIEQKTIQNVTATPVNTFNPSVPVPGHFSQKYLDIINAEIEAANMQGFDFFEFKKAIQKLESAGIEESARYKSVLLTASVTPDEIIKSTEHYKNVIENTHQSFLKELELSKKEEIYDKVELSKTLENEKMQIAEEINRLTARLEEIRNTQIEIQGQTHASELKFNQAENDFLSTKNQALNEIQGYINNINKYK